MKVQNCNNSPNFGILRSTKYYGQFGNKYGNKVIDALKNIPEFEELTKRTDVDVFFGNISSQYRYVYGYDGLQNTTDCYLIIAYDRRLSDIKKWFAKKLGTTQSYIRRLATTVKNNISDEMIDEFISSFNNDPILPLSLRCELNIALKEIQKEK